MLRTHYPPTPPNKGGKAAVELLRSLINIFIFPGFLFLLIFSLVFEYLQRKLTARLQNRIGLPWHQPLADLLKLFGKEDLTTQGANQNIMPLLPLISLAALCTAFIYLPIWGIQAAFNFKGDLIVVLYLLLIPTLTAFLAGWYSARPLAKAGAMRLLIQLLSFEIPLFMALLAPALLAGSWSLSTIAAYYSANPLLIVLNLPALAVALIAALGKLERAPFTAPGAKTEVSANVFMEYGGRLYAFFRLSFNVELVVICALIAAIFIPLYAGNPLLGMVLFALRTLIILFILTFLRALTVRLKVEQMVRLCWRYLMPLALLQIIINLVVRGLL